MTPRKLLMLAEIVIVSLSIWLGLWRNLGTASLHTVDEMAHTDVARNILIRHDWLHLWYMDRPYFWKPPLKIWLTALLFETLGQDEWVVRLPDALLATFTTLLVWRLARHHLAGPARLAAPVVFVLAPYPLRLHGWREGVQDSALTFLITAAAVCYLEVRADRRWLWAMGLALGAGTLVKSVVPFLLYVPAAIDIALSHPPRGRPWRTLAGAFLLSLLAYLSWHVTLLESEIFYNVGGRIMAQPTHPHDAASYWTWLREGFGSWGWFIPAALCALLFLTVRGSEFDRWVLLWGTGLVLPWLFASARRPWYLYPAYPAVALAIARTALPPELWRAWSWRIPDATRPTRSLAHTGARTLTALVSALLAVDTAVMAWSTTTDVGQETLQAAISRIRALPSAERSILVGIPAQELGPDERYYLGLSAARVAYAPSAAEASSALLDHWRFVVVAKRDLPEVIGNLQRVDRGAGLAVALFAPHHRRLKSGDVLPERAILARDGARLGPPFEAFPTVMTWDGFGKARDRAWGVQSLCEGGTIWLPFERCGTLRASLWCRHSRRRLVVELCGVREVLAVASAGTELAISVDVPRGGAWGEMRPLDHCSGQPSQVVSVANLRVEAAP